METIWNDISLVAPRLLISSKPNLCSAEEIQRVLLHIRSPESKVVMATLHNCAALLSRFKARRKNSFSKMFGFKSILKLNTALNYLKKNDIYKILDIFLKDVSINSVEFNYVEYVLIRLISVHKLCQRIVTCCSESSDYFFKVLKNNFYVDTIPLILTVVANTKNCASQLGNVLVDIYQATVLFKSCVSSINSKFQFPSNLDKFCTSKNDVKISSKTNSYIGIVERISTVPKVYALGDVGVAIKRDSLQPSINLSRINNIDDVKLFFKEESESRKRSLHTCASKLILEHEWAHIQKVVQKMIIAKKDRKALSIFRNFITNKL